MDKKIKQTNIYDVWLRLNDLAHNPGVINSNENQYGLMTESERELYDSLCRRFADPVDRLMQSHRDNMDAIINGTTTKGK